MERKKMERNLKLYKAYVLTGEPIFWAPVLVTSLIELGNMSLEDIYTMEAIVMFGFSVVEVHTGALADKIGRRVTVILGKILETAGMGWFAYMSSPLDAWIANCLFMLGISFCSGADKTLIVHSLKKIGYNAQTAKLEQRKIVSKASGYRFLAVACASLVTGFLAEIDLRYPLYLSIPLLFACISITFFFTEVPNGTEETFDKYWYRSLSVRAILKATYTFLQGIKRNVLQGLSIFFTTKGMLWITLTLALVGISSKVWMFTYNPYFALTEVPYRYYGYIFCALNIVSWYFSTHSVGIIGSMKAKTLILCMTFTIGVPMALMGLFVYPLSGFLVLFQNFTRGVSMPFFTAEFHHKIHNEDVRATLDSVDSALRSTLQAVCLYLFTFVLELYTLPNILLGLGTLVLTLGMVCVLTHKENYPN